MNANQNNYLSYSDEAYACAERFRSISSFSFPTEHLKKINDALSKLLKDSAVSEFKWQKLYSAKYRFCAQAIIDYVIDNVHKYKLRIDTIIWDTQDKRHQIINRNDLDNFGRMFYHLHKFLIEIRESNSYWKIFYDVRGGIDWNKIKDCLLAVSEWKQVIDKPLFNQKIIIKNYNIESILPVNSLDEPSCQVSDFFAGISVFSANKYNLFNQWLKQQNNEPDFFETKENLSLSQSERERFFILNYLYENCSRNKLGVSLKTQQKLITHKKQNPINFWFYVPQHEQDVAPVRSEKK